MVNLGMVDPVAKARKIYVQHRIVEAVLHYCCPALLGHFPLDVHAI